MIIPPDCRRQYQELVELQVYPREAILPIRSDAAVMDAGAHIGIFGIYLRSIGVENQVIAFEPAEANFELLHANSRADDDLRPAAVSTRSGTTTLRKSVHDPSTHWSIETPAGFAIQEIAAPAVRFAELVAGREWSIVKLDLEGHEAAVILDTPAEFMREIEVLVLETHTGDPFLDRPVLDRIAEAGLRQVHSRLDRHRVFRRR